jgi:hypothetical protein
MVALFKSVRAISQSTERRGPHPLQNTPDRPGAGLVIRPPRGPVRLIPPSTGLIYANIYAKSTTAISEGLPHVVRVQQPEESVDAYITALKTAANQIQQRDEQQLCYCIIRGLKPALRLHVLQNERHKLEAIQQSARIAEIATAGVGDNDKTVAELSRTDTLLVDRLTAKDATAATPPAAPSVAAVTSERDNNDRQPRRQQHTPSYNRSRGQPGRQPQQHPQFQRNFVTSVKIVRRQVPVNHMVDSGASFVV